MRASASPAVDDRLIPPSVPILAILSVSEAVWSDLWGLGSSSWDRGGSAGRSRHSVPSWQSIPISLSVIPRQACQENPAGRPWASTREKRRSATFRAGGGLCALLIGNEKPYRGQ